MGGDHTHKTAGGIGESLFTDNKALCIALGQNRRQIHIPGEQGYTGIYSIRDGFQFFLSHVIWIEVLVHIASSYLRSLISGPDIAASSNCQYTFSTL